MAVDGLQHQAQPSALRASQAGVRRNRPSLPRKAEPGERLDAAQAVAVEWDQCGQWRVGIGAREYEEMRGEGLSRMNCVKSLGRIAAGDRDFKDAWKCDQRAGRCR